jgi:hypothetical protein
MTTVYATCGVGQCVADTVGIGGESSRIKCKMAKSNICEQCSPWRHSNIEQGGVEDYYAMGLDVLQVNQFRA